MLFFNIAYKILSWQSAGQASAFVLLIGFVWHFVQHFRRLNGRLPPGPIGVPLLGYAPFLGQHPQHTITKLGEKYGNIFSFYMASQLTVVLNDLEAVRKCFVTHGDAVARRPTNYFLTLRAGGDLGITQANDKFWREQRRFAMRAFHDLGVSKSRFELLCLNEINFLVKKFDEHARTQTPCFSRPLILHSYANVVGALCFGRRFEPDNAMLSRYVDNIKGVSDLLGNAGFMQGFPVLRFLPPWRSTWLYYKGEVANELALVKLACDGVKAQYDKSTPYTHVENSVNIVRNTMHRQHSGTFDSNEEDENFHETKIDNFVTGNGHTLALCTTDAYTPQCLVEHFYHRRAWLNANGQQKLAAINYTDKQLHMMIVDIFGAATETSSNALNWAILFLALNPHVQTKAFKQIVDRIGLHRHVSWDDRFQLPYVEALVLETLRRGNQVPLGLARQPTADIFVDGYLIPRDAMIVPNIWHIHSSEKYFHEPDKFEPERMLNPDTGEVRKDISLLSFSAGKRSCIGAGIAKMDIFLFVATLLQKFEFCACKQSDGRPFPSADDYSTSINTSPRPYEVLIKARKACSEHAESKAGI